MTCEWASKLIRISEPVASTRCRQYQFVITVYSTTWEALQLPGSGLNWGTVHVHIFKYCQTNKGARRRLIFVQNRQSWKTKSQAEDSHFQLDRWTIIHSHWHIFRLLSSNFGTKGRHETERWCSLKLSVQSSVSPYCNMELFQCGSQLSSQVRVSGWDHLQKPNLDLQN